MCRDPRFCAHCGQFAATAYEPEPQAEWRSVCEACARKARFWKGRLIDNDEQVVWEVMIFEATIREEGWGRFLRHVEEDPFHE